VPIVRFGSESRPAAGRFAIFNHKGGVGKTTLTVNIGAALVQRGRRVLLVDSDPQCNLTSYLVDAEVVDDLLDNSDTDEGKTVWSAVRPVSEALGGFNPIEPIELSIEGGGLFLLPGDIRLSQFENDLNDFWALSLQRKARGFRGTTAISDLVSQLAEDLNVDYVLYDSGPNIGPLNRAILLDCDQFVVPVAGDLFSLRALKTLGRTLVDWIQTWQTIAELAPAETSLLPGAPVFLGYIPEGFRTYGGAPTQEHAAFFLQIEREIHSQIVALLRNLDPTLVSNRGAYKLGEVKHFGKLVPASQREGKPLYAVDAGSPEQRNDARDALAAIAEQIDDAWQARAT
jgi:cellulose biosynthesis protein BcsQ